MKYSSRGKKGVLIGFSEDYRSARYSGTHVRR